MARKEIVIDHDRISNSQTITDVVEGEFKSRGVDLHRHEATFEDDEKMRKRIYKVKYRKLFGPWSRRG